MEEKKKGIEKEIEELRVYFKSGKTKEAAWRMSQLKALLSLIRERESDFFKALHQDLGKHHVESFRDEIGTVTKSLIIAIKGLKGWMSSKNAKLPALALLTSAEVVPQPLGLVLVISSWNFPIGLSLEPLIGAISAGNTMVLKPSELAPACSALLAKTIPVYLDSQAIKVIQGGPVIGEKLLQQKWDKIFFTGSARVGRMVMTAAVNHLTPVILEMGGKCPAIVDTLTSSLDKGVAANRIIGTKFGPCAGQACIAIDYALVEKRFVRTLINLMKEKVKEMFGDDPKATNDVARIVSKEHFLRLKRILTDPRIQSTIVYGGSMDEEKLFIEPTILVDPPLDSEIMTDEVFGPLLPIITVKEIEESIDFINARPKPLAIYAFSKNKTFRRKVLSETSSGSLVFNDAIVQYAADTLPFGGIGDSGMGKYHGKYSFDAFTHYKAVAYRSFLTDFWFRFPPWNNYKLMLLEAAYNLNYIAIVLIVLGLKRSR
ncbi:hypothetical protein ACFE04_027312 [Oxalis oulophora]